MAGNIVRKQGKHEDDVGGGVSERAPHNNHAAAAGAPRPGRRQTAGCGFLDEAAATTWQPAHVTLVGYDTQPALSRYNLLLVAITTDVSTVSSLA